MSPLRLDPSVPDGFSPPAGSVGKPSDKLQRDINDLTLDELKKLDNPKIVKTIQAMTPERFAEIINEITHNLKQRVEQACSETSDIIYRQMPELIPLFEIAKRVVVMDPKMTAATDGTSIYFGIPFLAQPVTIEDLESKPGEVNKLPGPACFIVIHELMHMAYGHPWRGLLARNRIGIPYSPFLMNVIADIFINTGILNTEGAVFRDDNKPVYGCFKEEYDKILAKWRGDTSNSDLPDCLDPDRIFEHTIVQIHDALLKLPDAPTPTKIFQEGDAVQQQGQQQDSGQKGQSQKSTQSDPKGKKPEAEKEPGEIGEDAQQIEEGKDSSGQEEGDEADSDGDQDGSIGEEGDEEGSSNMPGDGKNPSDSQADGQGSGEGDEDGQGQASDDSQGNSSGSGSSMASGPANAPPAGNPGSPGSPESNAKLNANVKKNLGEILGRDSEEDLMAPENADYESNRQKQEEMQRALQKCRESSKARGKDPGNGILAECGLEPVPYPWQRVVGPLLTRMLIRKPGIDFRRPSRSMIASSAAFPDKIIPYEPGWSEWSEGATLAVLIDTSGSINDDMLIYFLRHLATILKVVASPCHLIAGDTQVNLEMQNVDLEPNLASAIQGKISGRGGTDFVPLMKRAEELEADVCIFLTDGYAPFPPKPRNMFMVWAVSPDGLNPQSFPYGKVVVIQ